MRLFIAFDIDEDTGNYLKKLQKSIGLGLFPRSFHVTLKFLGDVEESKVSMIVGLLKKLDAKSFTASLTELGGFPAKKHARVIWVGLNPREVIVNLKEKIDSILQDFFPVEHNFEPHVTLSRTKPRSCPELNILPKYFEVKVLKLVKSTLSKGGSVYEDLAVFHLS